jgi:hypothetical protein
LCSSESSELVCNAYQQAKSHQLPYPVSTGRSSKPFELVFSDVWGPAPESVGHQRYYVTFIDMLKSKSDVFQKFIEFQNMVERRFDTKIIVVQTDW